MSQSKLSIDLQVFLSDEVKQEYSATDLEFLWRRFSMEYYDMERLNPNEYLANEFEWYLEGLADGR